LRYRNPLKPGKYIVRPISDIDELHRLRIEIEGELQRGTHLPLSDNPTLAEYAWQYYDRKVKAKLARGSLAVIE
jgi:hypothetical protein